MSAKTIYESWLYNPGLDEGIRKELEAIKANPIVPETDLVNREKVIKVFEEVKKAADNYIGALRQDEKGSDADES